MLLSHKRIVTFTAADPYPEVGNGLVMDFAGLRTGGSRTYARNAGVRADSPTGIAGWSYSRTGELIVPDGDGLLRAVAANDPGIDPGLVTGAGLPGYEATTDLGTAATWNPSSVTNLTDRNGAVTTVELVSAMPTAAKNALLAKFPTATAVYKTVCDGSVAFQGVNTGGNLLANVAGSLGVFLYVESGATPSLGLRGASNLVGSAVCQTGFNRTMVQNVQSTSDRNWMLATDAVTPQASTFYWLLPSNEAKTYCTPPVPRTTTGASASRGGASANVAVALPDGDWAFSIDLSFGQVAGAQRAFVFDDGTTANSIRVDSGSGGPTCRPRIGNVDQPSVSCGVVAAGAFTQIAVTRRSGDIRICRSVAGVAGAVSGLSAPTLPTALSRLCIAHSGTGSNQANGPVRRAILRPGAGLSDADLQAFAAAA